MLSKYIICHVTNVDFIFKLACSLGVSYFILRIFSKEKKSEFGVSKLLGTGPRSYFVKTTKIQYIFFIYKMCPFHPYSYQLFYSGCPHQVLYTSFRYVYTYVSTVTRYAVVCTLYLFGTFFSVTINLTEKAIILKAC